MPGITKCDAIIIGGGVAGVSAAVAAARQGVRTLLVEKNAILGGAAVAGLHRYICGLYPNGTDKPNETINSGVPRELCRILKTLSPINEITPIGKVFVLPFRTADLMTALQSLTANQKNLEVMLDATATAVEIDGNAIAEVKLTTPKGKQNVTPGVVIDCSGDGTVARLSGARLQTTSAGERQLAGFAFQIKGLKNIDELTSVHIAYCLKKAVDRDHTAGHLKYTTFTPGGEAEDGRLCLNVPPSYNKQQAEKEAHYIHNLLTEEIAAFNNSRIVQMPGEIIQRDGPRIIGEYILTAGDVVNGRKFPDGGVKNAWPIELWDQQKGPQYQYLENGDYYQIPSGCFKSRDLKNLYSAGRSISATHQAQGSARVIGCSIATGEQAGLQAAQSITIINK
jgi:FAD dependent oxidoreductase